MLHLVYVLRPTAKARGNLPAFWKWVYERERWFYDTLDMAENPRWHVRIIGSDAHALEHVVSFADEATWGRYRAAVARLSADPVWERRRIEQDEWWEILEARLLGDAPLPRAADRARAGKPGEATAGLASPPDPAPAHSLLQMLFAPWVTTSISVVARLGIADLLADGPRSTEDLAARTGTHEPSLYRVLRMLVEAGLFREHASRVFELTDQGQQLRSDTADSLRAFAIFCGEPYHLAAWAELLYSVRTGEPAFDRANGQPFFDYLVQHEAEGKNFDVTMTNLTGPVTGAIVEAYDWSDLGTIVDVGGGNGRLLSAALEAHPHLTGILFDQPVVIERAREQDFLQDLLSMGRCRLEAGSFFETVPSGGDAYVLKYILHDWSDERCLQILGACRRAMSAGSRLLVVEQILTPGSGLHFGTVLDIEMLTLLTGQERTEREFDDLFARAGFTLTRVVPTASLATAHLPFSIIEARPAA